MAGENEFRIFASIMNMDDNLVNTLVNRTVWELCEHRPLYINPQELSLIKSFLTIKAHSENKTFFQLIHGFSTLTTIERKMSLKEARNHEKQTMSIEKRLAWLWSCNNDVKNPLCDMCSLIGSVELVHSDALFNTYDTDDDIRHYFNTLLHMGTTTRASHITGNDLEIESLECKIKAPNPWMDTMVAQAKTEK